MTQKRFLLLALTVGLLNAAAASAECDIQLSQSQLNYDPVTRGELVSRPGNSLSAGELRSGDEREVDIMVNCDRPTPLTLQFIGPAKDGESYRYGDRGRAMLVLHDVMIDDRQAQVVSAGQQKPAMAFSAGNTLSFWQDGGPALGTRLTGKVTVTTWISSAATRTGEHQTWQLDGRFMVGNGQ